MLSTAIPIRPSSRAAAHPAPEAGLRPFASSLQHVLAEVGWIELLVRAHVEAARSMPQAGDAYKGLVISDQEVDELLKQDPGTLPFAFAHPFTSALDNTQLAALRASIDARCQLTEKAGIELRLLALQPLFDLSPFDLHCIVLCLAPEADLRFERLYAYLQDDVTRRSPGVNLVLNLLCRSWEEKISSRARFASSAPLVRHSLLRLIEDPSHTGDALLSKGLRLDTHIAEFLLGGEAIDPHLRGSAKLVTSPCDLNESAVSPGVLSKLNLLIARNSGRDRTRIFYLWGAEDLSHGHTAEGLCGLLKQALLRVDVPRLLHNGGGSAELLLAVREARLRRAALFFEGFDTLLADDKSSLRDDLVQAIEGFTSSIFLSGKQAWHPGAQLGGCEFVPVEFTRPDDTARTALWQRHLSRRDAAHVDLIDLAGKFRFSGGQIADAARTAEHLALWRDPEFGEVQMPDLYEACRIHSSAKLASLGRRIKPHHTWSDIVLPEDRMRHLREICNCVKFRSVVFEQWGFDRKLSLGKGLNMLFAGPSGTGKTMAAEIIAGEVGLEVYKIDLSTVVSKYIGETEKNLARIFAEAEVSNAILFFDEADSLFGKRTEVRDAHDRYANIEINYLLQKMEEHEGVVILATNFRKNMDDAFVRRLHFTVELPLPCEADRRRIWEKIWPAETPLGDNLDLDFISRRFEIPGGNIRNIALAAAFLAANDGTSITMDHLLHATRREFQKMGKVVQQGEFGYAADTRASAVSA